MEIRDIATIFKRKGLTYKHVEETSAGMIYQVTYEDWFECYEVFQKKLTPVLVDFATRTYSDTEFKYKYPKDEDFGYWAWTYRTQKKAHKKLLEITDTYYEKEKTKGTTISCRE